MQIKQCDKSDWEVAPNYSNLDNSYIALFAHKCRIGSFSCNTFDDAMKQPWTKLSYVHLTNAGCVRHMGISIAFKMF